MFGVEIISGNVHFLDGFRRWDVNSVVRQPDEHVRGAVHAGIVVVAVGAVDVRAQGAFGSVGNSVLKYSGSRAWHQVNQRLVIPVLVEGHVQNGLFA